MTMNQITKLVSSNLIYSLWCTPMTFVIFYFLSNPFRIHQSTLISGHTLFFCHQSTRSSTVHKLEHVFTSTNHQRNFYFNRLPRTFNRLPVVNLGHSYTTIKFKLTKYLWQHFINNFDSVNQHSYHFSCPCSVCCKSSAPINFNFL